MGKRTEQFSKEEVQMAKKTHDKVFNIHNHKEMQTKTTLRFHLTPIRMAFIKKKNKQLLGLTRMLGKRNPYPLLVGM
jgi:hypothetical protein